MMLYCALHYDRLQMFFYGGKWNNVSALRNWNSLWRKENEKNFIGFVTVCVCPQWHKKTYMYVLNIHVVCICVYQHTHTLFWNWSEVILSEEAHQVQEILMNKHTNHLHDLYTQYWCTCKWLMDTEIYNLQQFSTKVPRGYSCVFNSCVTKKKYLHFCLNPTFLQGWGKKKVNGKEGKLLKSKTDGQAERRHNSRGAEAPHIWDLINEMLGEFRDNTGDTEIRGDQRITDVL